MTRRQILFVAGGLLVISASLIAAPQANTRRRPVPPAVEKNIQETLAAYGAGDDLAVEPWVTSAAGIAALPHIEAVVAGTGPWSRVRAAFLLEVAAASFPPGGLHPRVFGVFSLLLAGGRWVMARPRPLGADPTEDRFEVLWHHTAVGLAQGIEQYWLQHDYLNALGSRLETAHQSAGTSDTRVPLARAIAAAGLGSYTRRFDGEWSQDYRPIKESDRPAPAAVLALFEQAAAVPATRAEALIRAGIFLQKIDRPAEAAAWFSRVPAGPEPFSALGYLQQMSRARTFDTLGRPVDAAAAYRAALELVPTDQRAAIGLATALLRSGRAEDAATVAADARRMRTDPARTYEMQRAAWRADARLVPSWLAEIRKLRR
jgi:hypothetical protein